MKANLSSGAIAFVMMCVCASGCLSSDDISTGIKESATIPHDPPPCTMTVGTETAPQDKVVVTSTEWFGHTDCFGSCQVKYQQGDHVTLDVPFPTDQVNCIAFSDWTGACAGQGSTCHTHCDDRKTIIALWSSIPNCSPE